MDDEIAAWLLKQAEGDKVAALELAARPDAERPGIRWTGTPEGLEAWERENQAKRERAPQARLALTPQEHAVRAESLLAVIDEYEGQYGFDLDGGVDGRDYDERERDEAVKAALGHVVSLLAYGYRGREGYKETWKP